MAGMIEVIEMNSSMSMILAVVLILFFSAFAGVLYMRLKKNHTLKCQAIETQKSQLQQALLLSNLYLETPHSIIFSFDNQFKFLEINQKGLEFFDITSKPIFDFNWVERFIPEAHRQELSEALHKFSAVHNQQYTINQLHVLVNDTPYILSLSVIHIDRDEFGESFYLCFADDISYQVKTQAALQLGVENFENIVNKNQTGIMVVSKQGIIKFFNPAVERLMGRTREQLLDSYFGTPILSDPSQHSEFDILRADGKIGVSDVSFSSIQWQNEPAYLVMMYDITELKNAQQEIEDIALHDALTGLPNRRLFTETLVQTIERHKRNQRSFALLFLDLDRFKTVNDTLGHAVGDALLVQTAERISKVLRSNDFFSRMGGDEFTIILDDEGAYENVARVCEKIIAQLIQPYMIEGQVVEINASIGVVFYPDNAVEIDDLLKMADLAMYKSKKMLNKSYHFYDEEMMSDFNRSFDLESALKQAIKNNEFELYYQPQAQAGSLTFSGMEALIRWRDPKKGLVSPAEFIPALERTGLILQVGTWVLYEAVRQLQIWLAKGYICNRVSINVCVLQFLDDDFVNIVKQCLAQYKVDAKHLAIEITESILIENKTHLFGQLEQLQALGIHIHMDDFGTGYSSLSMIKDIPFDTIKIDQSFVKDLLESERDRVMVRSIINTIHAYDKCVLVEGVELEAQRVILAVEGCDQIQGYLFARPMPADELEKRYLLDTLSS